MYKLYHFEKVDFWLTVRIRMRNYVKFDQTLHTQKTDSEIKMRVRLSAYSTTPSARSILD